MIARPELNTWYSVCLHCTAKWYDDQPHDSCPRCGREAMSVKCDSPPWFALPVEREQSP